MTPPPAEPTRPPGWLMLVDMQRIFAEPASPWAAPEYARAAAGARRLRASFGDERVCLTRFVPPRRPTGAWVPYYRQWPFALDPASADLYGPTPGFAAEGAVVVERTTFGKWDAAVAEALGHPAEVVLAGVSTDCCVLSTALAAADAGVRVRVAADACAGATAADHERALAAMALYAPLIEVTTVKDVLD